MQGREPTFGDGRYLIRRELGRGTMGVVYEAEDGLLGRTVALKTIELALAAGPAAASEFEQRFFTEARVAARLSHPGIVVCHDVGKDPASGKLFIVFERLLGRTLADRAAEGTIAWRGALEVVVQVARAIHHAHEHGVVHRDLKPANIMLLDPGTGGASAGRAEAAVKIMDFGVARFESLGRRLTRTGQAFGSPLYMSPEQALGQPSTARSDIFSLGSVLCTLVLGRAWFEAPSLPKIVDRVVHDDAPRVSRLRTGVPASLDAVVAMALAKREDDRYASAAHMADDLEDVLAGKAPRHAGGAVLSSARRAPGEDGLLAGLTAPMRASRTIPPDPLASLLDEPAAPASGSIPGEATVPLLQAEPAGASALVTARSRRRWVLPAGAVLGLAVLSTAAFALWRRASAPDPTRPETVPVVAAETPPAVAPAPTAPASTAPIAPVTPASLEPTPAPVESTPASLEPAPARTVVATPARTAATPAAAVVRPSPAAAMVEPNVESPAIVASPAGAEAEAPSIDAAVSRIKLAVEHPFENGRLIVWVDGVLVHETKLQAHGSKRVVGFKVREGRTEKMLDVEPGKHEVRVEVTWDQNRRASTKVVDVASGATGLLEVRVGRMTKDLNLSWSRLAKD